MKKTHFFLALCLPFVGCASSNIVTKEAYTTTATAAAENTYYVTSPKVVLSSGSNNSIVFSLQRTVAATPKNVTFILSYVNPSTGFVINVERYDSFKAGESSKPVNFVVPAGAKVNLILFEQDKTGTYQGKDIAGKSMIRLI